MPYNFTDLPQRQRALQGAPANLKQEDPAMHYLLENIETLWVPKKVNTNMDWLATQKENG